MTQIRAAVPEIFDLQRKVTALKTEPVMNAHVNENKITEMNLL